MIDTTRALCRAAASLLVATPVFAQFDPHSPLARMGHGDSDAGLAYRDIRTDAEGVPLESLSLAIEAARSSASGSARATEIARLALLVHGLKVDSDPYFGTPRWVGSTFALLTAPVPGYFRSADLVRGFVAQSPALFEIAVDEIDRARVSRDYKTKHNGVNHLTWQQQLAGVDIFGCELRANVTRDGQLINLSSTMLARPSGDFVPSPVEIGPAQALQFAAADLHVGGAVEFLQQGSLAGANLRQAWTSDAFRADEPIISELIYFPRSKGDLRSAWALVLPVKGIGHTYDVIVDATDGTVLRRENRLNFFSSTQSITLRAFTDDSPAPGSPGTNTPTGFQFPLVPNSLVTVNPIDVTAFSPNGWIDDGGNETLGNNVDAHSDLDNNNVADLPRPQGSPFRTFDFPQDLTQAPSTYTASSIVNFFYLANRYHDKLYSLGFDEAAGNFQTNNFALGGTGGDAVLADCQDGGGTDNANFGTTGTDGSTGRCQMYIWNNMTPNRDGSLDSDIVYHELTHGTSIRLHGGLSGTQPGGMGEGWGDFMGRCINSTAGENPNDVYGTGCYATYLLGSAMTFADNYYFGIRRFPYSTDLNKNPTTYADTDVGQQSYPPAIPRSPVIGNTANEVHNVGEIWCNMLLECRANLIASQGFAGNEVMMQLVIDGMKLSVGNPSFLQARDAILQADLVDNGGANQSGLWNGFAKRGCGLSATSPASSTTAGIVEAFDVPSGLAFEYPSGLPSQLLPGAATSFPVHVNGIGGTVPTPGSGLLFYSVNGGSFLPGSMIQGLPNEYTAVIPATNCLDSVRFYVSSQGSSGLGTDPVTAPASSYAATTFSTLVSTLSDTFETSLGWSIGAVGDTATTGIWERADPQGTAAQPEDDHTAVGTLCFVTGATAGTSVGSNDVDGGKTTLTSPTLNLAANPTATISYWRWYSNNAGAGAGADVFRVDISNDNGTNWVNAETVGPTGAGTSGGWIFHQFSAAAFVAPTAQVRVRFVAEDAGTGSIIEAALDDFQASSMNCNAAVTPYCFGDGSGTGCPCANNGGPGVGCQNSTGFGGGLSGSGNTSVSSDTLVLTTSGTPPTASVIFFQGNNQDNGGAGVALFDGLRCTSGSVIRLGVKASVGGSTSYPQGGDLAISVKGLVPAGGATRHYQAQYRDPAVFCAPETSNFTSAVTAVWTP